MVCDLPRFIKNHVIVNGWQLDSRNTFYAERILSAAFQNSRSQCDIVIEPIIGEIKRPEILSNAEIGRIFHLKDMFRHNLTITKKQLKKLLKQLFLKISSVFE